MALTEHPAYEAESRHLADTLSIIEKETCIAEDELIKAEQELKSARAYDPDKLPVREMLYAKAAASVKSLSLSAKKPYFTRIDFKEDGKAAETVYIGKYGLIESQSLKSVVVDWRAPLANLYYSGQLGRVNYTAPDGKVEGELTLKRQFDIDGGRLLSIFDTDIVSQDAYLEAALNAMTGDRLKEIVTTIQAEQNYVIRHPLKRNLIVAGAAGSGKTTIALHRIAYLLYAFSDQLRPENMLIIAPNPLFLNYIAGVLPDLGVENVKQTTFHLLIRDYLQKSMPKADVSDQTEAVLSMPENELKALSDVAQFKGSMRFLRLLDAFLDSYEADFAPDDGFSFGPVQVYTKQEMDQFLLEDEKPFPMKRRVSEFQKQLSKRVNAAAKQLAAWFTKECDRRAGLIRESEHDAEIIKTKLRRLYETRDERIKQVNEQVKPFISSAISSLPTLDAVKIYSLFWEGVLASSEGEAETMAAEHTLRALTEKLPLSPEDIAPVAYIHMRMVEKPRLDIRHIVIDEAQDFNPFEICLLSKMMPSATFTIVGDLMQGIHAWRAITDWDSLAKAAFDERCTRHNLATSYRNTVEIMSVALRAASRRPTPGQIPVKPVERHGSACEWIAFTTPSEQLKAIENAVSAMKKRGMGTVAVIARTQAQAKALAEKLSPALNARLLDVNDTDYSAPVYVAPASGVKGLEFDGVIIADASPAAFPDRELDARLLYVCLTRPLHSLTILYQNKLTPLLK